MTTPTDALRLVPVEPNHQMHYDGDRALANAVRNGGSIFDTTKAIWSAMLAAAPASPLPEGGGQCSGISGELKSPDLDALEKLADEATPGPWTWDGYGLSSLTTSGPVIHDLGYDGLWIDEKGSDASFIAAANPTTIKALIAELKEARAALEPFADHFVIYQADTPPMTVIPITTEYRHIRRAFLARNGKGERQ